MRQTIKVEDILEYGNKLLMIDPDMCSTYPALASKEYKEAVCDMLEKILHMSDRYSGYWVIDSHKQESNDVNSPLYWKRKYYIKNK